MYNPKTIKLFEKAATGDSTKTNVWTKKDITNVLYFRALGEIIKLMHIPPDFDNLKQTRLQLILLKKDYLEALVLKDVEVKLRIVNNKTEKQKTGLVGFSELENVLERLITTVDKPDDMDLIWWPSIFDNHEDFEKATKLLWNSISSTVKKSIASTRIKRN